jgi:anion-transporting  ArsA/GET3 family ATPase
VDTAPSGHTLRLLDLTGSYHRQVMADAAHVHGRITTPLTRLRDPAHTRVLIVALPELTPSPRPRRFKTASGGPASSRTAGLSTPP